MSILAILFHHGEKRIYLVSRTVDRPSRLGLIPRREPITLLRLQQAGSMAKEITLSLLQQSYTRQMHARTHAYTHTHILTDYHLSPCLWRHKFSTAEPT
jgi:hypothetical protein